MDNPLYMQLGILVIFIFLMYFLLIRPQKKKEREVESMRNSIRVGDDITTIGGICGKVVKIKDETLVIQVGSDRVKFEIKRWAVSNVEAKTRKADTGKEEAEETPKTAKPKRLGKNPQSSPGEDESKQLSQTAASEPSAKEEVDTLSETDDAE